MVDEFLLFHDIFICAMLYGWMWLLIFMYEDHLKKQLDELKDLVWFYENDKIDDEVESELNKLGITIESDLEDEE